MQYLSADTILALRFGGISKSTDGGDSWTYFENPPGNYGWNELFYVNQNVGYVGGTHYGLDQGIVYKTIDGGQTYTLTIQNTGTVTLTDVIVTDPLTETDTNLGKFWELKIND